MAADYGRDALESLGKIVNRAGKILLGLLGLMFSFLLILNGLGPETIKVPLINFSVSSRTALKLFGLGVGGGGWILWFTLRHAFYIIHHLEAELKVHPTRIRAVLARSSFLTNSVFFFLKFPVMMLFFFWVIFGREILAHNYVMFGGSPENAFSETVWPLRIFLIPYLLIYFGPKYNLLNPRHWGSLGRFLKYLNSILGDNDISMLGFKRYDDEVDFLDSFISWAVRRNGLVITLVRLSSENRMDKMFKEYLLERMEVQILHENNGVLSEQDREDFHKFSKRLEEEYFA